MKLKLLHDHFHQYLHNSSFASHYSIRCCMFWGTGSAIKYKTNR